MKTTKYLTRLFITILILIYLNYGVPALVAAIKARSIPQDVLDILLSASLGFMIVASFVTILLKLFWGEFNNFFSKRTDPIIEKIEKWLDRRNINKDVVCEPTKAENEAIRDQTSKPGQTIDQFKIHTLVNKTESEIETKILVRINE